MKLQTKELQKVLKYIEALKALHKISQEIVYNVNCKPVEKSAHRSSTLCLREVIEIDTVVDNLKVEEQKEKLF